jgi:geranylgeranyl diphosphate synthase type II
LPTVHHRWNVNTAILSGDALFALSFEPVAGQVPPIPTRFTRAGLEVCEGQQRDMDLAVLPPSEVKVEDYIEMIRQKTGVLIGASLELGALAAGAPEEVALLFRQAGEQGGIAFQIQDDLLDITATPEEFGKQFAGDILENKKTIFWLHTWHQATTRDQEALLAWTQVPAGDAVRNESKIRGVLDLFEKYGAFQAGQKRMEEAFVEMEKSIQELENRPEIRPEGMAEIRTFFQSLSQRKR